MTSPSPSLARAVALQSVRRIKESHGLVELGSHVLRLRTTLQWSRSAVPGSTPRHHELAVLLGVYRVERGRELTLDAPVHVRNKFTSIAASNSTYWTSAVDPELAATSAAPCR
jgi:hypothetical protein